MELLPLMTPLLQVESPVYLGGNVQHRNSKLLSPLCNFPPSNVPVENASLSCFRPQPRSIHRPLEPALQSLDTFSFTAPLSTPTPPTRPVNRHSPTQSSSISARAQN